jgi:hypothetical protein
MGQMLLLRRPSDAARQAPLRTSRRSRQDPGAPARGILLALALSSCAWMGLALLLPRFW